jgi:hypothetical protein
MGIVWFEESETAMMWILNEVLTLFSVSSSSSSLLQHLVSLMWFPFILGRDGAPARRVALRD